MTKKKKIPLITGIIIFIILAFGLFGSGYFFAMGSKKDRKIENPGKVRQM